MSKHTKEYQHFLFLSCPPYLLHSLWFHYTEHKSHSFCITNLLSRYNLALRLQKTAFFIRFFIDMFSSVQHNFEVLQFILQWQTVLFIHNWTCIMSSPLILKTMYVWLPTAYNKSSKLHVLPPSNIIIPKSSKRAQSVHCKNFLALQEHLLQNVRYRGVFQVLINSNLIIIKMRYLQH